MDFPVVIMVFAGFAVLAIFLRWCAGTLDHERIGAYITSNGGRVESIHWAPFGPGWFGEKSDRIYQVRYVDSLGQLHEAHCKTSLTTGVYFTQDRVRTPVAAMRRGTSPFQNEEAHLAAENQRLRAELARLKKERGQA